MRSMYALALSGLLFGSVCVLPARALDLHVSDKAAYTGVHALCFTGMVLFALPAVVPVAGFEGLRALDGWAKKKLTPAQAAAVKK